MNNKIITISDISDDNYNSLVEYMNENNLKYEVARYDNFTSNFMYQTISLIVTHIMECMNETDIIHTDDFTEFIDDIVNSCVNNITEESEKYNLLLYKKPDYAKNTKIKEIW